MVLRCMCAVVLAMALAAEPSVAQEAVAIAIEGWEQRTGDDGVVTFRCASAICAAGSVVSYKAQPHRTGISLADFEKHHRGLADQNKGHGRIKDVRLSDFSDAMIEGVRVLRVNREVDWSDGQTTYTIDARLIGQSRSFSLVSDSPQRDWTANNFDGFLRSLAAVAGIEGR